MSTKLQRYKLSSLIDVKRGQSISGEYYASEGEHVRLTLANFDYVNGGFKVDTQKDDLFYTGPVKPECLLKKDDIITPLTEQALGLLGSTARIPESDKYVQSGDIALVTCKEGLIDPNFCYYLLPSKQVKKQLAAGSQQTKIRHTSPDAIKACIVDIPEYEQQKKIGEFLSLLDRKISLNRAINKNLEALAKQIYNYWFVQFDFPDENGCPYKSSGGKMVWNEKLKREIPIDWEVVKLSDYLKVYIDKISPTDVKEDDRYAPIEVIPRHKMSFCEFAPIENAVSGLCRFKRKHILLSNRRVYFHKVCIAAFDGLTRDTVIIMEPLSGNNLAYSYQLVNDDVFIEYATRNSYGSEQPVFSWEGARNYNVLKPSDNLDIRYSDFINPIIEGVLRNEVEIETLIKLRNELLPLLMNGQVTIE